MKKITLITILTLGLGLFSSLISAQNVYTYTLIDNGNYNYSIAAVADAGGTNEITEVQSHGYTILLPDGITITIQSSLGSTPSETDISAANITIGDPAITNTHGYLITETLSSTINLPNLPATGLPNTMVTFQVNGTPTVGDISIVANNSTLGGAFGGALKAYMSADTTNTNVFPPVVTGPTGLSGTTSYSFTVLGVNDIEILSLTGLHVP